MTACVDFFVLHMAMRSTNGIGLKSKRRFTRFTGFYSPNADDMCSHAQLGARGTHAPPLFLYFQCVPVAPIDYLDFSKSNDLMCFEITCDNCKFNCCLCKLVKEICVCVCIFFTLFMNA